MRPTHIPTYQTKSFPCGEVFYEEEYPTLLFGKDGEIYHFNHLSCLVIGGAYSVDKHYRLLREYRWFADEQPSDEIKRQVEEKLSSTNYKIDIILSHTCPLKYEPTEVFLDFIDQSAVDKSTEKWLNQIEKSVNYKKWYCGYYHTSKRIDRFQFMFEDIDTLKIT